MIQKILFKKYTQIIKYIHHSISFSKVVNTLLKIQAQPSLKQKKHNIQSLLSNLQKIDYEYISKIFEYSDKSAFKMGEKSFHRFLKNHLKIQQKIIKQQLNIVNDVPTMLSKLYPIKNNNDILQLKQLIDLLKKLQFTNGQGSTELKQQILQQILDKCTNHVQIKFIARIILANLNIGLTKKSIQPLLKQYVNTSESFKSKIYKPMVSKSLKNFKQLQNWATKNKFNKIVAELKYDGQRTMIYYKKNKSILFISRNGNNQSHSFPDLINLAKQQLDNIPEIEQCILDGEIICLNKYGKPTPIQILMSRKGSSRLKMTQNQNYQKIMIFDILHKNNQQIIDLPYSQRIKKLPNFTQNKILYLTQKLQLNLPQNQRQLFNFFTKSVNLGYQGLILKSRQSNYDINQKRKSWAKLKKDCQIDSQIFKGIDLDLILMGAFRRKQKQNQNIYGSFLMGTKFNHKIYPLCKVGTGINQKQLQTLSQIVQNCKTNTIPQQYIKTRLIKPDIWCYPKWIFQIQSQELTRSPVYQFGLNQNGGISLRFPKFIRLREDKSVEQSTNGEQILQIVDETKI